MAEKKNTKTTKTNTTKSSAWGINKISLYVIVAVAILYLVSLILALVGVNPKIIVALQGVATAIMICIVAVLAWRYVAKKQPVWKVLYVLSLLVVVIGVIIPLIKL